MQGSLETRFLQSTSDYKDVLQTGVIEKAKAAAVETGLRQLIDDTTEGVLILKDEDSNSVLCWLTGIPSSREDYMHTKIRYAIALEDEPGTMQEWARILCGLYSNQEQLKSLGKFLDDFIQDNKSVKPDLTFAKIADFLKNKVQAVQTDGIAVGCEFVLASYLAEPNDTFKLTSSKGRSILPSISVKGMRLQTGVFWNGIGFSEVSHNLKKKRAMREIKSAPGPKSETLSGIFWVAGKTRLVAGVTVVLILLAGIGLKLNYDSLTKENKNLSQLVVEQKGKIKDLKDMVERLNREIPSKEENTKLRRRVEELENKLNRMQGDSRKQPALAPSADKEKPKLKAQPQDNKNQSSKNDKADRPATQKK